ncbi:hypothetical protein [Ancylothrix sp. D3o]|nr:hypothetical protein [Ancylothrix sp. D3o]
MLHLIASQTGSNKIHIIATPGEHRPISYPIGIKIDVDKLLHRHSWTLP